MLEVKLVEQGFQWTTLIAPGVTLLGVWFAFFLHRKNEKKQFEREKAERLLGEVISLESLLKKIDLEHDMPKKNKLICKMYEEIEEQFSTIEALTDAYFPQFIDKESEYSNNPDNLFMQMYSFRSSARDMCDAHSAPTIGEPACRERDDLYEDAKIKFDCVYSDLKKFRQKLSAFIKQNI